MFQFLRRIVPKEEQFFDFFEEHCGLTIKACEELLLMTEPGADLEQIAGKINELEHQADTITHRCIKALQRSFITPFDRIHVHRLMVRLDDIVDQINYVARRVLLYEIRELRLEVRMMGEVVLKAVRIISEALRLMRDMKNQVPLKKAFISVHQLENEGDDLLRAALTRLFKEEYQDPLLVIKWKDIFEHLEFAADLCEDVVDVIQGVVIEAS